MEKQYIVRLKRPEPKAIRSIESFLKERTQDIPPTPRLTRGIPSGRAIPAYGPMLYGGDVDMIPGRPAEVSDYQSTADGRLWVVTGSQAVLDELGEEEEGVEIIENIGLEVPKPSSLELMAGGIGDAGSSYHLKLLGVDSSLRSQADGSGVRVAIIDSGLDPNHSEFKGTSYFEAWDYYRIPPTSDKVTFVDLPPKKRYEPRNYHGTAVAGMLCGALSGVAPRVTLIIHNVFYQETAVKEAKLLRWKEGGKWHYPETDLARVEWALNRSFHKKVDADIILLSMGRPGYNGCFNEELINDPKATTLVVAAIGNDGPRTHCSPGDYEYVLSVGATDANDQAWLNPKTGKGTAGDLIPKGNASYRVPVIYAPGANLILPVPEHIDPSGYITRSGTSFAAPLVAGVAALVMGWYKYHGKKICAKDVKELLLETADPIKLPDELGGTGLRVNAARVVKCLKDMFPTS